MDVYSVEEQYAVEMDKRIEELSAQLNEANSKRYDAEMEAYQYKTAFTILVNHLTKTV